MYARSRLSVPTRKLRLGLLPKTESAKLTFACPAGLKTDLNRYATLHAQAYGEGSRAVTLIRQMLEAFMARDRDFKRKTSSESTSKRVTSP